MSPEWLLSTLLILIHNFSTTHCSSECSTFVRDGDLTLCRAVENFEDRTSEYKDLSKKGIDKSKEKVFPERKDYREALLPYDGPLYPVPVGPSVYFLTFIALLLCWYLTACTHHIFDKTRKKLKLHPETAKFPNIPLYWLQESKREIALKREVRNTWAWLARRYLLSPDDPFLDGITDVLGLITWDDFHVPRDTWSLLNVILKINQLYLKVKKNHVGESSFSISQNQHGSHDPFENVPDELLPEGFHEEIEDAEDIEENQPGIFMYTRPSIRGSNLFGSLGDVSLPDHELDDSMVDDSHEYLEHHDHEYHDQFQHDSSSTNFNTEAKMSVENHVTTGTHQAAKGPQLSHKVSKKKKKVRKRKGPIKEKSPAPIVPKPPIKKSMVKKKTNFKFRNHKEPLFPPEENPLEEYEPVYGPPGSTVPEDRRHSKGNEGRKSIPQEMPIWKDPVLAKYLEEHPSKSRHKHRNRHGKNKRHDKNHRSNAHQSHHSSHGHRGHHSSHGHRDKQLTPYYIKEDSHADLNDGSKMDDGSSLNESLENRSHSQHHKTHHSSHSSHTSHRSGHDSQRNHGLPPTEGYHNEPLPLVDGNDAPRPLLHYNSNGSLVLEFGRPSGRKHSTDPEYEVSMTLDEEGRMVILANNPENDEAPTRMVINPEDIENRSSKKNKKKRKKHYHN